MSLAEKLAQGVAKLRLDIPPATQHQLLDYLALIQKWNKVYNLTAVREAQKMVSRHLLDCLAVVPHVRAHSIIDVGSGAGLPGIPLALALPQSRVTLLEASHKKATFLKQAVIELGLGNVDVVCERAETWQPPDKFEVVISRAFSDLPEFLGAAGRLCAANGTIAAMKGVYPDEEIAQLPPGYELRGVVPLTVPGLEAERHLVLMQPARQAAP